MTEYWKNRFLENSKEIFRKDEEYVKEISKLYNQAINDLEGQISKILNSMDEVSLHEAKKIMNNTESKVFKEGLKRFEELSKGTLTKDIEKELQTIYKRSRISRLQAMQLSLKTQISKVLNQEQKKLFAHLSNTFTSTYYKDLYTLQRIQGFEKISGLSEDFIDTIIKTKWAKDGKDFSDRIWQRKDKLINTLNTDLKIDLITGKPINVITNNISKKLEVSKNNAKRLVRTESSAIHSISRKSAYERMGVEKYQIVATLDLKTSEICRSMDGKVFNYSEREEGVTAPPFHCNCRTTDAPYFDDDLQDIIEGRTRMSRDPNTKKSVGVKNMTYNEWYKKYVKGKKKEIVQNIKKDKKTTTKDIKENLKKDIETKKNIETQKDTKPKENTKDVIAKPSKIEYKHVDENIEKELQKRSDKIWNKKLLGSEQNALYEYSNTGYGITNRYLGNRLYDDDDIVWNQTEQNVKELDRVLSRHSLGDDLILHRGIGYKEFEVWKNSTVIQEYKSTSISDGVLETFSDGYEVIIKASKNTKGFYLGNYSDVKSEKEFLMMRNQKYRILNIEDTIIEVEFYE